MKPTAVCLFCGGDASERGHLLHCDGRQGAIEAAEPPFKEPVAITLVRVTDPSTSHAAAESIVATASEMQSRIYGLFTRLGQMTDEQLLWAYQDEYGVTAESSPRKRRHDLKRMGWIEDSGELRVLKSGRFGIVWRIVDVRSRTGGDAA